MGDDSTSHIDDMFGGEDTDDSKSGRISAPSVGRRGVLAGVGAFLAEESLREAIFQDQSPLGDTIWDGFGSIFGMRGLDQSYGDIGREVDAAKEVSGAAVNEYLSDLGIGPLSSGMTFNDGRYRVHTNTDDIEGGQGDFHVDGTEYVNLTNDVFGDEDVLGDQFSIAIRSDDDISEEMIREELESIKSEYKEAAGQAEDAKTREYDVPSSDTAESLSDMEKSLSGRLEDDDLSKGSTHYEMIKRALGDDKVDGERDRTSTVRGAMAYLENQEAKMGRSAEVIDKVIDNLAYSPGGQDDSGQPGPDPADELDEYRSLFDDVDHCYDDEELDTAAQHVMQSSGGADPDNVDLVDTGGQYEIRLDSGPKVGLVSDNC